MTERMHFSVTFPHDGSILDRLSVEVGTAEHLAVFGPNGGGKSSMLRSIAGTIPGSKRNADVAYLPQTPYMFRGSARDNLMLGSVDQARATSIVEALGVGMLLDRPATELSGGEAQRVALARVMAGREALVLLDEPLAPIDGADRHAVARVIRDETAGRALVCVTHSIDNAAALAESLAVLDGGRLVQIGPIAHVLASPLNERVARLVGVANVLEGEVVDRVGDMAQLRIGGGSISTMSTAPVGSRLVIKVPAETVAVFTSPPLGASVRSTVEGQVTDLVPRGGLVEVMIAGEVDMVALVTHGALDALDIERGTRVWFGIKTAAVEVIRVT